MIAAIGVAAIGYTMVFSIYIAILALLLCSQVKVKIIIRLKPNHGFIQIGATRISSPPPPPPPNSKNYDVLYSFLTRYSGNWNKHAVTELVTHQIQPQGSYFSNIFFGGGGGGGGGGMLPDPVQIHLLLYKVVF